MKKVYSLLTMAVIAAMSLTMTSCDGDIIGMILMVGTIIMMIGDGTTMIGIMVGKEVRRIMDLWKRHSCLQANGMDQ